MKNTNILPLETSNSAIIDTKRTYAAHLQMSMRSIDNLLANGLPAIKISGRMLRINRSEADAWLAERYKVQRRGGLVVAGQK